jgi:hypothetical protein
MLPPAWKSRPGTTSLQKPERSGSLCRFEARTRRCIPCAVSTRRRSATLCTRVCACAASAYCSEPICSAGCLNYRPDAADFPVNANSASRDRHSTPKTNSKLADCSRDIAAGVSNPTNASARWPGGRQASRTIRASRVSPNNFRSRRQPSSEGRTSLMAWGKARARRASVYSTKIPCPAFRRVAICTNSRALPSPLSNPSTTCSVADLRAAAFRSASSSRYKAFGPKLLVWAFTAMIVETLIPNLSPTCFHVSPSVTW